MTVRRPLVAIGGRVQELPLADSLPGGGGAGATTLTEVTLDFGATPVFSKTFTILDAAITAGTPILVGSSGNMPAGVSFDEHEMDALYCVATCAVNGTITLLAVATPGPIAGTRNIIYKT